MRHPIEVTNDRTGRTTTVPRNQLAKLRTAGWRPADEVDIDAPIEVDVSTLSDPEPRFISFVEPSPDDDDSQ